MTTMRILTSRILLVIGLCLTWFTQSVAEDEGPPGGEGPYLAYHLNDETLRLAFPGAERFGEIDPALPVAPVYKGDELLGYVFETHDIVQGIGFSKKPFMILVGLDLTGHVVGTRLAYHTEPIAILGRTDDDFHEYLKQFKGLDVRNGVSVVIQMTGSDLGDGKFAQRTMAGDNTMVSEVDAVSRTTTSSIMFSDSIVRASRIVAAHTGINLGESRSVRGLDRQSFTEKTWPDLIEEGSIAHLQLTHGQVLAAFEEKGLEASRDVKSWKEDEVFFDLYVALATPLTIGRSIMQRAWYDQYTAGRGINDLLMLVMATGEAFKWRDGEGENYERLRMVQGDTVIPLARGLQKELPFLHAKDRPEFTELSLFFFSEGVIPLNPTEPWRFELTMQGREGEGSVTFMLPYAVPEQYILEVEAEPAPVVEVAADEGGASSEIAMNDAPGSASEAGAAAPLASAGMDWRPIWQSNESKIWLLVFTLAALVLILSFQEAVVRVPWLHTAIRIGFLAWVLVWMGWMTGAQLTIINLLNLADSVATEFRPDFFMMEPLIVIISGFVGVGLFLWGRAIFCGWLCPFGALQELLNKFAQLIRLPQIIVPHVLQERLFAVKYVIFLGLLVLLFVDFNLAMQGTQVEPFKTAITFRFDAPWPAVTYALILLGIGLFVERFYCRFICPLGAGLSILGRVRMFNWLKRKPECGNPCKQCESVCPVGAIQASGAIDMNECFYCLDCQVVYYDDQTCPPLIRDRKRRERLGVDQPAVQPEPVAAE